MSSVHGKGRSARTLGQKDPRNRRLMNRWDRPELILGDGMEIDTSSKLGVAISATPGLEFSGGLLKVKVKALSGILIGADGLYGDTTVLASLSSFNDHSARHENGGADEISVAGLSGLLADGQTPLAHTHPWSDITGEPTTLAGYGITDGATDAELAAHEADTTSIHGIADTSVLLTTATKLDDLAAPDDNTDLNVSTTLHGLAPKAPNDATKFLDGTAAWDTVKATDIASLTAGVLIGRTNASGGSGQEITPGAGIEVAGTTLRATDAMTVLVASADQDVTNAQNTDSTYFTFAVTAAKWYLVDALLGISGNNTTGDFECRFAVAAGTMNGGGTMQSLGATLTIQNVAITASAAANTADLVSGTTADLEAPQALRISFAFVPSDTTTFKLQFGNSSAAAGRTSRLKQGSILRYKQMN